MMPSRIELLCHYVHVWPTKQATSQQCSRHNASIKMKTVKHSGGSME